MFPLKDAETHDPVCTAQAQDADFSCVSPRGWRWGATTASTYPPTPSIKEGLGSEGQWGSAGIWTCTVCRALLDLNQQQGLRNMDAPQQEAEG